MTQPPYPPPPGQSPHGQDPYGQNPYGQGPYGYGAPQAPVPPYAHWWKRAVALLIDSALAQLAGLPLWIGYIGLFATTETTTHPDGTTTVESADPTWIAVIALGFLTSIAFVLWNVVFRQGRTGYTVGKGLLGIRLVREDSGQPLGAGLTFVRQLAHLLDGLCCYIGYLWPLWDAKRQTFADKIMSSIVIDQPRDQPQDRLQDR